MLTNADCARLAAQHIEQAEGGFCETCGSLWEWPCAVRALLDAQAQAAPVLVAAEAERDRAGMLLTEWKVRAGGAERWAKQCQERAEAAEAAQAQAAPVLVAATRWEYDHRATPEDCIGCLQLLDAVSTWRAAWEG